MVTMYLRYNAAASMLVTFSTTIAHPVDITMRANTGTAATAIIYATTNNTALTVSATASVNGTITYTPNFPTQSLFIAKVGW
jgi:hypothetical protein